MTERPSTPLMSRIPIPRFIDLDEESQLQKVEATAQVRYSHWEESRQKQQKKQTSGAKKTSSSKSKSSKSKDPLKEAEKLFSNLSKEQLEKIKKEAGL